MPIRIRSGDPAFDALPETVAAWLEAAAVTMPAGGTNIRGYRAGAAPVIALHEQTAALNAGVYFDHNVTAALDVFLQSPMPDGALYDLIRPLAPLTAPNLKPTANGGAQEAAKPATPPGQSFCPPSRLCFDDLIRSLHFERPDAVPNSESYAAIAAYRVWQATGNDEWILTRLPILERGLDTLFLHPHRWSTEAQLPKRPFTLDDWPIAWADPRRRNAPPGPHTKWCIHPGDAARLFEACSTLTLLCEHFNIEDKATRWRDRAAKLQAQLAEVAWQGRYFTHQVHLSPIALEGIDENAQLAACNAFLINSGIATQEQCAWILQEYANRSKGGLEWWSIEPPYPAEVFDVPPGNGPNGGIWPLVGGELSRAALSHGFEAYGIGILRRYHELAVKSRRSHTWYAADGTPGRGRDGLPHGVSPNDAPGAAAMLHALIEGVCGIRDNGKLLDNITLSPRWPATGQFKAEVEISYAATPSYFSYRWSLDGNRMTLDYEGKAKHVALQLMLPRGNMPERVALNGKTHPYTLATIEKSRYVHLQSDRKRGTVAIMLK
jgi:hypothetical protein